MLPHLDKCASEVYTGTTDETDYESDKMLRGKELEPFARELYSLNTFNEVKEMGYVELGKYLGDSPDGLVSSDGCLEIKCRKLHLHFAMLKAIKEKKDFKMPPKDRAQCYWHMFVCERKWCDYISYHPNFPEHQRLAVKRLEMDDETL